MSLILNATWNHPFRPYDLPQLPKEAIQNNMNNWRAGILTAGEARARSISRICDERATTCRAVALSEGGSQRSKDQAKVFMLF